MSSFNDFIQTELPKRIYANSDGLPGQIPVRSSNPSHIRELVWRDAPGIDPIITVVAGPGGVSGNRAVAVNADGTVSHANPLNAGAYIGISKHAAIAGDPVEVAFRDYMNEPTWVWVPGLTVYYVADGMLTQTVPVTDAITPVAVATLPTQILITRQEPVFL